MCIYIKFRRQLLLFHLCDKKDDINKKKENSKTLLQEEQKTYQDKWYKWYKNPPSPDSTHPQISKRNTNERAPLFLQATKGNPWTDLYLESYRGRLKAKGAESSSRLTAKPSPLSLLFKDRDSH